MTTPRSPPTISPPMFDLHLKLIEISLFIRRKLRDHFDQGKSSLNQYRVLRYLKNDPNLSLSSLKTRIIMKKGNLSRMVDSMVRQDLIDRQRDSGPDRRKIALSLTAKGEKVLAELDQKQADLIKILYQAIPDNEIGEFNKTLANLEHYLEGLNEEI